jgi:galactokinase
VRAAFEKAFGRAPDAVRAAPGRVNLIGEHTDYNGGFMLPMAIPQTTVVALGRRSDQTANVVSVALGERASFELGSEARRGAWIDYLQGDVVALRAHGYAVGGFDAVVGSDVPVGAGLSSSAALDVAFLRAARSTFGFDLDDLTIAKFAQAAEVEFVGAPVGIMDPMASSLADERSALFIDARSLAYERVPLPSHVEVVVLDSGVTHRHVTGGYASRRRECEEAARALGVPELRDVANADEVGRLPEPLRRRAKHVVSENARVLQAVACLREARVEELGALLSASHASLRDDFEVSVPEVDRLVARAEREPGVLGARITGGGFGGAVVVLCERERGARCAELVVLDCPGTRVLVAPGQDPGRA